MMMHLRLLGFLEPCALLYLLFLLLTGPVALQVICRQQLLGAAVTRVPLGRGPLLHRPSSGHRLKSFKPCRRLQAARRSLFRACSAGSGRPAEPPSAAVCLRQSGQPGALASASSAVCNWQCPARLTPEPLASVTAARQACEPSSSGPPPG